MEIVLELPRDIDKLCRTCMNFIDNENGASNFVLFDSKQTELYTMFRTVTSLKVTTEDGLPRSLCSRCAEHLKNAYNFILQSAEVEENLKNILKSTECTNGEIYTVSELKPSSQMASTELENDFTCNACQKSFSSYYELSIHLITHNSSTNLTQRFEESHTNEHTKSEDYLSEEIAEHRTLIEECRNSFRENAGELVQQEKTQAGGGAEKSKKDFQCQMCSQKFSSDDSLQEHFSNGCTNENKVKCKRPLCNLCGKLSKDFSSLSLHFLNHTLATEMLNGSLGSDLHFCEYCGQIFETDDVLNSHYLEQHQNSPCWECIECMTFFRNEKDYLNHSNSFHGINIDSAYSDGEIDCILCSEKFNSRSELHKHCLTHVMKRYTCRKCPLSFCTQYSHFSHLQVHCNKKHICSLCGKCLSTNSALKSHVEGVHSVELQHCCAVCGKCFATTTRLKTHSKIHTSEKKFVCSYCGYKSHKSGDLVMHIRTHTSERPYKCTYPDCTMSFKTSSHLCHHIRRHFKIKKYNCSICLMKFNTNHGLKVHQLQHTGEKPHPCIVCKKQFRRKYHLKIHMKQHNRP